MWPHLLCAGIGIWLMAAPEVLGYGDPAQTNDHITGPLLATFALIAAFQSTRGVRWVDALLGLWLVFAPWVLGYEQTTMIHSTACGVGAVLLSLVRGPITAQFGGGWRELWRDQPHSST